MPSYDQIVQQLQSRDPLPPLYPVQIWDDSLSRQIAATNPDELFGSSDSNSSAMVDACRAGLLLWNDDLEASHNIAQGLENPTGSFWHAIMHRREGDPANSHYWWRRTGAHPAFAAVYTAAMQEIEHETDEQARELAQALQKASTWVPMEFVARCELARRGYITSTWPQRVQVAEMQALLNWCRTQSS